MTIFILILSFIFHASASEQTDASEELNCNEPAFTTKLSSFLSGSKDYYFYFEAGSLQELQTLKNCIDYSKCGTDKESIVDDEKNYRMHIWASFSKTELSKMMNYCPIKDLHKKIIIRKKNQHGNVVSFPQAKEPFAQSVLAKEASPAIFHKPSEAVSKRAVEKIGTLLKQQKVNEAQDIAVYTWGIDLRGYSLNYTGKSGNEAVTDHESMKIEYGKEWINEPCEFIRMIRHEAEHVAQMNQSLLCDGDHNFQDHKMRERAAHLNDALFINTICPGSKIEKLTIDYCLSRFRKDYFNK